MYPANNQPLAQSSDEELAEALTPSGQTGFFSRVSSRPIVLLIAAAVAAALLAAAMLVMSPSGQQGLGVTGVMGKDASRCIQCYPNQCTLDTVRWFTCPQQTIYFSEQLNQCVATASQCWSTSAVVTPVANTARCILCYPNPCTLDNVNKFTCTQKENYYSEQLKLCVSTASACWSAAPAPQVPMVPQVPVVPQLPVVPQPSTQATIAPPVPTVAPLVTMPPGVQTAITAKPAAPTTTTAKPTCVTATTGTCRWMGCSSKHGKVECSNKPDYKCVCQKGTCATKDVCA